MELAGVVGPHIFYNRLSTMSALPPRRMEEFPDRWYVRLFRPLAARRVRSMRRRADPDPLRAEEREGLFSHVVLGLDGLPFARALRAALDGMWASAGLSRRAKGLILAVVARTLGCPLGEQEAARLLLAEGLERPQFDEILAHLASPFPSRAKRSGISPYRSSGAAVR